MKYTDEHLNYWGEVYCRARLLEYDVPFAVFVRNPWKFLNKVGAVDPDFPIVGRGRQKLAGGGLSAGRREIGTKQSGPKVLSLAVARERRDARAAALREKGGRK